MSQGTGIEWTDATWNPVVGCMAVSAGCANCYAVGQTARLEAMGQSKYAGLLKVLEPAPGADPDAPRRRKFNGTVRTVEAALAIPLRWRKPRRVFINSMSDLFFGDEADERRCAAEGVPFRPVPFEFIDRVLAVVALTPQHRYQLLTKRPVRMAEYFNECARRSLIGSAILNAPGQRHPIEMGGWPLPNLELYTSVEHQPAADERIPHLLACPAAVRGLSIEPLLGPIKLRDCYLPTGAERGVETRDALHHIILGGESHRSRESARPCALDWIRDLRDQARRAGVAVYIKQLGARVRIANDSIHEWPEDGDRLLIDADEPIGAQGEPMLVRTIHPKGGDMREWPEDLRVRELPREEVAAP